MEALGIANCDLSNIDYKIGTKVLSALVNINERYPESIKRIDYIGDIKSTIEEKNRLVKSINDQRKEYSRKEIKDVLNTSLFVSLSAYQVHENKSYASFSDLILDSNPYFIGLGISKNMPLHKYREILLKYKKANYSYSTSIESCIYHEFGHVFERLFCFDLNPYFMEKIRYFMADKSQNYPKMALLNESEFIAECFAKYMIDPNYNEAVNFVGTQIDEFYDLLKNSTLFRQNKVYRSKVLKIAV